MRSHIHRNKKYSAKLDGDVLRRQITADGDRQKALFRVAVVGQVEIEQRVRLILNADGVLPMFNHFYMDFGKRLGKIGRTHGGNIAQVEACIQYEKWSARGLLTATLDKIIAVMGFQPCVVAPPPCDWDFKRKLTFSGNVSATNLNDFPVLVHLTVANFDFAKAQNLGEDIRFMDSDTCPSDGIPLKHEIEQWDKPGNNAWVWVKVPRIDGGTVNDFIYMFYGNAVAPDGQDVNNTWEPNYKGVWHMHLTAGMVNDSTSQVHHLTNNGTVEVGGKISQCLDFEALDPDNLNRPAVVFDWSAGFTLGLWIKYEVPGSYFLIEYRSPGVDNFYFYTTGPVQNRCPILSIQTTAGAGTCFCTYNISDTNWHHVHGIWDLTHMRIYVDGTERVNCPHGGNAVMATAPLRVGMSRVGTQPMDGYIDEIRIASTPRSADWIQAQFRSQDETLITYGPEE